MSDLKRAVSGPVTSRIQYNAQFHADFDAEVEIDTLDIQYRLDSNFTMSALITIEISAISRELNAYMRYLLEMEVNLSEEDTVVVHGRDFGCVTDLSGVNKEILHEAFVAEFYGTIQFEVA